MKYYTTLLILLLSYTIVAAQSGNYNEVIGNIADRLASSISQNGKRALSVTDFTTVKGKTTELGEDIANDLETALLSTNHNFRLVSRDELNRILAEQEISRSRITEKDNVKRIGNISNVDVLVVGKISDWGEYITIQVQLLDVETANLIGAAKGEITATNRVRDKFSEVIDGSSSSSTAPSSYTNDNRTSTKPNDNFPIERDLGDLKLVVENISQQASGRISVTVRVFNSMSRGTEIGLYNGNYHHYTGNDYYTRINNYGDMYYSTTARVGTVSVKRNYWGKIDVAQKAWVKATITFENVPKMDQINVFYALFFYNDTNGKVKRIALDLRDVPVNRA
jgi:curli biogenesis system outer membrane secretion channel CsgG